jgi:hypothetical protein
MRTLLLSLFLFTTGETSATCLDDSWAYTASVERHAQLMQHELPRMSFQEVEPKHRERATALLQQRAFVRIRTQDVQRYVATLPQAGNGESAFLVRALREPNPNGGFFLFFYGRDLSVGYSSLGPSGGAEAFKTAVVVYLREIPRKVYVGCSGAV